MERLLAGDKLYTGVKAVEVHSIDANVTVKYSNYPHRALVSLTGNQDLIDAFDCRVDGSTLIIGNPNTAPATTHTSSVQIVIYVANGTPTTFNMVNGLVNIGDTHGPVTITTDRWDTRTGSVGNLNAKVTGRGDLDVASVTGTADLDSSDRGRIIIRAGRISHLNATVHGSGAITMGGIVNNGELLTEKAGRIIVAHARKMPQAVRRSDSGSIKVHRIDKRQNKRPVRM